MNQCISTSQVFANLTQRCKFDETSFTRMSPLTLVRSPSYVYLHDPSNGIGVHNLPYYNCTIWPLH